MNKGFYQDELRSSLGTASPSDPAPLASTPGPTVGPGPTVRSGRPASPTRPAGVGTAALQHLVLAVGGPLGAVVGVLVGFFLRSDPRPLVRDTARAIRRFVLQLLVPGVAGVVLLANGEDTWGVVLLWSAFLPLFTVPLLAAWRTWRTGRVFRYPILDLLRPPAR